MNIIGIGIDIENIERFEYIIKMKDTSIFRNIYSTHEIKYCFSKNHPAQHLAVRFAAKEAVIKALSGYEQHVELNKDIEIMNSNQDIPMVKLNNKKFDKINISVSLSHSQDLAIASVIAFI